MSRRYLSGAQWNEVCSTYSCYKVIHDIPSGDSKEHARSSSSPTIATS